MEDRYFRQVAFSPFGSAGQKRLGDAVAVVVGAGALGSTMLSLLCRAGTGTVRIIDDDRVSLDNLHRQFLYTEEDVRCSRYKAEAAVLHLKMINSAVRLEPHVCRLEPDNAGKLLEDADIILDATDSFYSRDTINTAALRLALPWVYAGVTGSQGAACPFLPGTGSCFRCYLPNLPNVGELPDMESHGIIGPIVTAMAAESVACVLRFCSSGLDYGLMSFFDIWSGARHRVYIEREASCPVCGAAAGG